MKSSPRWGLEIHIKALLAWKITEIVISALWLYRLHLPCQSDTTRQEIRFWTSLNSLYIENSQIKTKWRLHEASMIIASLLVSFSGSQLFMQLCTAATHEFSWRWWLCVLENSFAKIDIESATVNFLAPKNAHTLKHFRNYLIFFWSSALQ